jgi:hypothetical protein
MTELRFRYRHVRATIADYVEQGLVDLGWVNEPRNFGILPITFNEVDAETNTELIKPNLISITLGNEPEDDEVELGGGLEAVEYPFFVDIYAENTPIALSIASDVKKLLKHRATPVLDYTTGTGVPHPTEYMEFEEIEGPLRPDGAPVEIARNWRVVNGTAVVYFVPD